MNMYERVASCGATLFLLLKGDFCRTEIISCWRLCFKECKNGSLFVFGVDFGLFVDGFYGTQSDCQQNLDFGFYCGVVLGVINLWMYRKGVWKILSASDKNSEADDDEA